MLRYLEKLYKDELELIFELPTIENPIRPQMPNRTDIQIFHLDEIFSLLLSYYYRESTRLIVFVLVEIDSEIEPNFLI